MSQTEAAPDQAPSGPPKGDAYGDWMEGRAVYRRPEISATESAKLDIFLSDVENDRFDRFVLRSLAKRKRQPL
jgi:hypothetical protein